MLGPCAPILAGVLGFFLQAKRSTLGIVDHIASLIARLRYLKGDRMVTWNPMR